MSLRRRVKKETHNGLVGTECKLTHKRTKMTDSNATNHSWTDVPSSDYYQNSSEVQQWNYWNEKNQFAQDTRSIGTNYSEQYPSSNQYPSHQWGYSNSQYNQTADLATEQGYSAYYYNYQQQQTSTDQAPPSSGMENGNASYQPGSYDQQSAVATDDWQQPYQNYNSYQQQSGELANTRESDSAAQQSQYYHNGAYKCSSNYTSDDYQYSAYYQHQVPQENLSAESNQIQGTQSGPGNLTVGDTTAKPHTDTAVTAPSTNEWNNWNFNDQSNTIPHNEPKLADHNWNEGSQGPDQSYTGYNYPESSQHIHVQNDVSLNQTSADSNQLHYLQNGWDSWTVDDSSVTAPSDNHWGNWDSRYQSNAVLQSEPDPVDVEQNWNTVSHSTEESQNGYNYSASNDNQNAQPENVSSGLYETKTTGSEVRGKFDSIMPYTEQQQFNQRLADSQHSEHNFDQGWESYENLCTDSPSTNHSETDMKNQLVENHEGPFEPLNYTENEVEKQLPTTYEKPPERLKNLAGNSSRAIQCTDHTSHPEPTSESVYWNNWYSDDTINQARVQQDYTAPTPATDPIYNYENDMCHPNASAYDNVAGKVTRVDDHHSPSEDDDKRVVNHTLLDTFNEQGWGWNTDDFDPEIPSDIKDPVIVEPPNVIDLSYTHSVQQEFESHQQVNESLENFSVKTEYRAKSDDSDNKSDDLIAECNENPDTDFAECSISPSPDVEQDTEPYLPSQDTIDSTASCHEKPSDVSVSPYNEVEVVAQTTVATSVADDTFSNVETRTFPSDMEHDVIGLYSRCLSEQTSVSEVSYQRYYGHVNDVPNVATGAVSARVDLYDNPDTTVMSTQQNEERGPAYVSNKDELEQSSVDEPEQTLVEQANQESTVPHVDEDNLEIDGSYQPPDGSANEEPAMNQTDRTQSLQQTVMPSTTIDQFHQHHQQSTEHQTNQLEPANNPIISSEQGADFVQDADQNGQVFHKSRSMAAIEANIEELFEPNFTDIKDQISAYQDEYLYDLDDEAQSYGLGNDGSDGDFELTNSANLGYIGDKYHLPSANETSWATRELHMDGHSNSTENNHHDWEVHANTVQPVDRSAADVFAHEYNIHDEPANAVHRTLDNSHGQQLESLLPTVGDSDNENREGTVGGWEEAGTSESLGLTSNAVSQQPMAVDLGASTGSFTAFSPTCVELTELESHRMKHASEEKSSFNIVAVEPTTHETSTEFAWKFTEDEWSDYEASGAIYSGQLGTVFDEVENDVPVDNTQESLVNRMESITIDDPRFTFLRTQSSIATHSDNVAQSLNDQRVSRTALGFEDISEAVGVPEAVVSEQSQPKVNEEYSNIVSSSLTHENAAKHENSEPVTELCDDPWDSWGNDWENEADEQVGFETSGKRSFEVERKLGEVINTHYAEDADEEVSDAEENEIEDALRDDIREMIETVSDIRNSLTVASEKCEASTSEDQVVSNNEVEINEFADSYFNTLDNTHERACAVERVSNAVEHLSNTVENEVASSWQTDGWSIGSESQDTEPDDIIDPEIQSRDVPDLVLVQSQNERKVSEPTVDVECWKGWEENSNWSDNSAGDDLTDVTHASNIDVKPPHTEAPVSLREPRSAVDNNRNWRFSAQSFDTMNTSGWNEWDESENTAGQEESVDVIDNKAGQVSQRYADDYSQIGNLSETHVAAPTSVEPSLSDLVFDSPARNFQKEVLSSAVNTHMSGGPNNFLEVSEGLSPALKMLQLTTCVPDPPKGYELEKSQNSAPVVSSEVAEAESNFSLRLPENKSSNWNEWYGDHEVNENINQKTPENINRSSVTKLLEELKEVGKPELSKPKQHQTKLLKTSPSFAQRRPSNKRPTHSLTRLVNSLPEDNEGLEQDLGCTPLDQPDVPSVPILNKNINALKTTDDDHRHQKKLGTLSVPALPNKPKQTSLNSSVATVMNITAGQEVAKSSMPSTPVLSSTPQNSEKLSWNDWSTSDWSVANLEEQPVLNSQVKNTEHYLSLGFPHDFSNAADTSQQSGVGVIEGAQPQPTVYSTAAPPRAFVNKNNETVSLETNEQKMVTNEQKMVTNEQKVASPQKQDETKTTNEASTNEVSNTVKTNEVSSEVYEQQPLYEQQTGYEQQPGYEQQVQPIIEADTRPDQYAIQNQSSDNLPNEESGHIEEIQPSCLPLYPPTPQGYQVPGHYGQYPGQGQYRYPVPRHPNQPHAHQQYPPQGQPGQYSNASGYSFNRPGSARQSPMPSPSRDSSFYSDLDANFERRSLPAAALSTPLQGRSTPLQGRTTPIYPPYPQQRHITPPPQPYMAMPPHQPLYVSPQMMPPVDPMYQMYSQWQNMYQAYLYQLNYAQQARRHAAAARHSRSFNDFSGVSAINSEVSSDADDQEIDSRPSSQPPVGITSPPATTKRQTTRPARRTPVKFKRHYAFARFSHGGQLLLTDPVNAKTSQVFKTSKIEPLPLIFKEFPGPFSAAKTHKIEVKKYLAKRIEFAESSGNLDLAVLLKYLCLLVQQNGSALGTDISEVLLNSVRSSSPLPSPQGRGSMMSEKSALTENRMEDCNETVETIRELLIFRRHRESVDLASKSKYWGFAFRFSNLIDPMLYDKVCCDFDSVHFSGSDVMQTFISIKKGQLLPEEVLENCACNWQHHLSVLLSNKGDDSHYNSLCLCQLGDALLRKGCGIPAQLCYILADVPCLLPSDHDRRLTLLGSFSSSLTTLKSDYESIFLTMIYEYGLQLRNSSYCIPRLQLFKFFTAKRLLEFGFQDLALLYCENIAINVISNPGLFNMSFVRQVTDLSASLVRESTCDWLESLQQVLNPVQTQPQYEPVSTPREVQSDFNSYAEQMQHEQPFIAPVTFQQPEHFPVVPILQQPEAPPVAPMDFQASFQGLPAPFPQPSQNMREQQVIPNHEPRNGRSFPSTANEVPGALSVNTETKSDLPTFVPTFNGQFNNPSSFQDSSSQFSLPSQSHNHDNFQYSHNDSNFTHQLHGSLPEDYVSNYEDRTDGATTPGSPGSYPTYAEDPVDPSYLASVHDDAFTDDGKSDVTSRFADSYQINGYLREASDSQVNPTVLDLGSLANTQTTLADTQGTFDPSIDGQNSWRQLDATLPDRRSSLSSRHGSRPSSRPSFGSDHAMARRSSRHSERVRTLSTSSVDSIHQVPPAVESQPVSSPDLSPPKPLTKKSSFIDRFVKPVIGKLVPNGPNQMHLPQDRDSDFYWDPVKKKWVDTTKSEETTELAPPPMMPSFTNGAPSGTAPDSNTTVSKNIQPPGGPPGSGTKLPAAGNPFARGPMKKRQYVDLVAKSNKVLDLNFPAPALPTPLHMMTGPPLPQDSSEPVADSTIGHNPAVPPAFFNPSSFQNQEPFPFPTDESETTHAS